MRAFAKVSESNIARAVEALVSGGAADHIVEARPIQSAAYLGFGDASGDESHGFMSDTSTCTRTTSRRVLSRSTPTTSFAASRSPATAKADVRSTNPLRRHFVRIATMRPPTASATRLLTARRPDLSDWLSIAYAAHRSRINPGLLHERTELAAQNDDHTRQGRGRIGAVGTPAIRAARGLLVGALCCSARFAVSKRPDRLK